MKDETMTEFKVVPVEPTGEMIGCAGVAMFAADLATGMDPRAAVVAIYAAMLAAAPPAPMVRESEIVEKLKARLASASINDRRYERPITWEEADELIAALVSPPATSPRARGSEEAASRVASPRPRALATS
jgi:hypothetical protein